MSYNFKRMTGSWLLLLLLLGAARPGAIPFERATAQERASLGEKVRGVSGARPGVTTEKHGQRVAIVAALGEKRTGGYSIEITRVTLRGSLLTVKATVTEPARDAIVTQALTYPFDVVWISAARLARVRRPLTLRFTDEKRKVLAEGASGQAR